MGEFTGGYTSAVNDQVGRQGQEATAAHLIQLIAARALAEQRATEDRDRMMQGRTNAGMLLPSLFPQQGPPSAGPVGAPFAAPTGPMPQSPAPGQPSVPMQGPPPMGAPGGMTALAPDSTPPGGPQGSAPEDPSLAAGASVPQAAPMPVGWQPSPAAGPELGGRPSQQQMQGNESGIGEPPPAPKIPPQLLSVPNLIQAMQARKIPPDQMVDTLHQLEPLINSENRFAVAQFKAENDATKAANAAYKAAIDKFKAENAYRNTSSLIDTRAARADQGQQRIDQGGQALQAKLARANGAAAAGGAEPEALTEGGLAVASELARAGLPMPGGWSKAGIARGNAILNRMAADQEGGPGSGSIATGRGTYKADQSSYQQRQKQVDALEAASKKIEKDIATMTSVMDKGVAGSVTLVNKPMNVLRREFSDPDLTKYALAVKQVGVEYERMINGGLLSVAQLHEGAREDAAKIINENMTPEQIKATIPIMLQEIANQRNAHHEQLDEIKARMKGTAGSKSTPTTGPDGTRINVTPDQSPAGRAAMDADIALKGKVEAAGQKYEPDKFDYKVEGGKVFRKPK